jgi:hypothetical protein
MIGTQVTERSITSLRPYVSNGVQKGPPIGVEEGPPLRI